MTLLSTLLNGLIPQNAHAAFIRLPPQRFPRVEEYQLLNNAEIELDNNPHRNYSLIYLTERNSTLTCHSLVATGILRLLILGLYYSDAFISSDLYANLVCQNL